MNATTLDINLSQTLANKTLVVTTILVSDPNGVGSSRWRDPGARSSLNIFEDCHNPSGWGGVPQVAQGSVPCNWGAGRSVPCTQQPQTMTKVSPLQPQPEQGRVQALQWGPGSVIGAFHRRCWNEYFVTLANLMRL